MKKHVFMLLCIITAFTLVQLLPCVCSADEMIEDEFQNCEFDGTRYETENKYLNGGFWPANSNFSYTARVDEEDGTTYAEMMYASEYSGTFGMNSSLPEGFTAVEGDIYEYECRFRVPQNIEVTACLICSNGTAKTENYQTLFNKNGTIENGSNYLTTDWYLLKVIIDTAPENRTIQYYIDDTLCGTKVFASGYYIPLGFQMKFSFQNIGEKCLIDRVSKKVSYSEKKYTYDFSIVDGADNAVDKFPLTDGKVKLIFSDNMKTPTKENFDFSANGEEKDFNMQFDGKKTVTITPESTLQPRAHCRLSFGGLTTARGFGAEGDTFITFDTEASGFSVYDISCESLTAGESTKFNVTVQNKTETENAVLLICVYSGNAMKSYRAIDVSCAKGETAAYNDVSVNIPGDFSEETHKLWAYVIDKTTGSASDNVEIH